MLRHVLWVQGATNVPSLSPEEGLEEQLDTSHVESLGPADTTESTSNFQSHDWTSKRNYSPCEFSKQKFKFMFRSTYLPVHPSDVSCPNCHYGCSWRACIKQLCQYAPWATPHETYMQSSAVFSKLYSRLKLITMATVCTTGIMTSRLWHTVYYNTNKCVYSYTT